MFKQFKVQKAERALEIFLTALTKQPSCQFPNEAITAARRFCIIREIENYVASMLRAQKFNGSPQDLGVLRILKMLRGVRRYVGWN